MGDNGRNMGSFLAGAIVGGLAGMVLGLLWAPQSGEETRERIRQKSIEMQGAAEETLDEARTKAEAVAADIKRRAEALQIQSQSILEEAEKQLTEAVEEVKKAPAEAEVAKKV